LEARKARFEVSKERKAKAKKDKKKGEKEDGKEKEEEQVEEVFDDGFDPDEYWKSMTIDQTKIVEKAKTAAELAEERRLEYERDKEVRAAAEQQQQSSSSTRHCHSGTDHTVEAC
jgi:hypothetical protein